LKLSDQKNHLLSQKEDLITSLRREGILKTEPVEKALRAVPREDFIYDSATREEAYFDEPLPLGNTGQTISAPHMVTIMLEELCLAKGQRILEVGTGTGYNACLLAYIVSGGTDSISEKLVTTVERSELLAETARRNIERSGFAEIIEVIVGDGSLGYPPRSEGENYDRIVVTAGAPKSPPHLEKQLKPGGILLIPIGNLPYQTLFRITKEARAGASGVKHSEIRRKRLMPCMFVPLVGENGYAF
jgi:protein-L-isoaspartate(D-aspartate) O-methyltransferase